MHHSYKPRLDLTGFLKRWDSLFYADPEDRLAVLNAMSDAEVNYHIAPSLRSMLTRSEKIEEHMTHIARENGELDEEDDMDF